MLRHLGEQPAAGGVEEAVRDVIAEGKATTYDLGGTAGTSAVRRRDHRADGGAGRFGAGRSARMTRGRAEA